MKRKHVCIRLLGEECNCPECREVAKTPIYRDEVAEDFLARTRRINLIGCIDDVSSAHVCNSLQILSQEDRPIYLYINSGGGEVSSGYAIIDQILSCRCPVYTIVRGEAHSMGAIIAAFGAKGCRFATPNSSIMLHSFIVQCPPEPVEKFPGMASFTHADYMMKVSSLSKRLKITKQQLLELMNKTMWLSPKQAIKVGVIDHIWTPKMEQAI